MARNLVLLGVILAACGHTDAYLAGPALPLHRGMASASVSRRAALRSRASRPGLSHLKAQLRPEDDKELKLLGEALKDAVGKFNSGELSEDAGATEKPSWLPLLTLPVCIAACSTSQTYGETPFLRGSECLLSFLCSCGPG